MNRPALPSGPPGSVLAPSSALAGLRRASWLRPSLLVAALAAACASACYRPSISEGGLACASKTPYCPDGFSCISGHCFSMTDALAEKATDAGADHKDASADAAEVTLPPDAAPDGTGDADGNACVPRQAPSGCVPRSDLDCDPVCQTGCCTSEKCTALNTAASGSSVAALACEKGQWLRDVGETCDVLNAGTAKRTDNCLPGLLCVEGNADAICMKLCRGDADCAAGVSCESRRIEPTSAYSTTVCGLPAATCNPLSGAVSQCQGARTCYLITGAGAADRTVCDISSGDSTNGASCKLPSDCLPGWTCPLSGDGASRCQPVCSHDSTPPNACPRGLTCRTGSGTYDICL